MAHREKSDLYALLHEVGASMGRGPRQGYTTRPGQNKVLKILDEHGSMRQRELLDRIGVTAATLSELLRKIEKEGYVTRSVSKADRREIIVDITEKGRISALECRMSEAERDQALFGFLSDDERETLAALLNKLLATWDRQSSETAGQRRERRWKENALVQEDQRKIDAALDSTVSHSTKA